MIIIMCVTFIAKIADFDSSRAGDQDLEISCEENNVTLTETVTISILEKPVVFSSLEKQLVLPTKRKKLITLLTVGFHFQKR